MHDIKCYSIRSKSSEVVSDVYWCIKVMRIFAFVIFFRFWFIECNVWFMSDTYKV